MYYFLQKSRDSYTLDGSVPLFVPAGEKPAPLLSGLSNNVFAKNPTGIGYRFKLIRVGLIPDPYTFIFWF
ncbi:hypothetical protein [Pedobacter rhizosphaerae]|uniref:Uncharacterized protein n=1 Tax=Pedobacter rhizosphaerae TaxID=390241 RepID=A0A1H9NRX9_9SPHI|nr:hypothetical protein [Pedobacter rhizosphaerae]SER38668.1 hypothetical protein SAMN04488023_10887 [Pedobacter rhizosphaerae]